VPLWVRRVLPVVSAVAVAAVAAARVPVDLPVLLPPLSSWLLSLNVPKAALSARLLARSAQF
jgi:hypothetical protein